MNLFSLNPYKKLLFSLMLCFAFFIFSPPGLRAEAENAQQLLKIVEKAKDIPAKIKLLKTGYEKFDDCDLIRKMENISFEAIKPGNDQKSLDAAIETLAYILIEKPNCSMEIYASEVKSRLEERYIAMLRDAEKIADENQRFSEYKRLFEINIPSNGPANWSEGYVYVDSGTGVRDEYIFKRVKELLSLKAAVKDDDARYNTAKNVLILLSGFQFPGMPEDDRYQQFLFDNLLVYITMYPQQTGKNDINSALQAISFYLPDGAVKYNPEVLNVSGKGKALLFRMYKKYDQYSKNLVIGEIYGKLQAYQFQDGATLDLVCKFSVAGTDREVNLYNCGTGVYYTSSVVLGEKGGNFYSYPPDLGRATNNAAVCAAGLKDVDSDGNSELVYGCHVSLAECCPLTWPFIFTWNGSELKDVALEKSAYFVKLYKDVKDYYDRRVVDRILQLRGGVYNELYEKYIKPVAALENDESVIDFTKGASVLEFLHLNFYTNYKTCLRVIEKYLDANDAPDDADRVVRFLWDYNDGPVLKNYRNYYYLLTEKQRVIDIINKGCEKFEKKGKDKTFLEDAYYIMAALYYELGDCKNAAKLYKDYIHVRTDPKRNGAIKRLDMSKTGFCTGDQKPIKTVFLTEAPELPILSRIDIFGENDFMIVKTCKDIAVCLQSNSLTARSIDNGSIKWSYPDAVYEYGIYDGLVAVKGIYAGRDGGDGVTKNRFFKLLKCDDGSLIWGNDYNDKDEKAKRVNNEQLIMHAETGWDSFDNLGLGFNMTKNKQTLADKDNKLYSLGEDRKAIYCKNGNGIIYWKAIVNTNAPFDKLYRLDKYRVFAVSDDNKVYVIEKATGNLLYYVNGATDLTLVDGILTATNSDPMMADYSIKFMKDPGINGQ